MKKIGNYFLKGLLFVAPVAIVVYILYAIFVTVIMCPANVIIQGADGNELAVVRTDDAETVKLDGLAMLADGDVKYLYIAEEYAGMYNVVLQPTDTMIPRRHRNFVLSQPVAYAVVTPSRRA